MTDMHRDEIAKLEALYASNPGGRVFTHLAEAYRKAGALVHAKEILASGLERHPDYPSAHVVLGRVLQDLGEREDAASAFRRVLELDRHNLVALRALGDLAVEAGRFEEARHYFGELIQIDPSDLETADRLEALPEGPGAVDVEEVEDAARSTGEPEAEVARPAWGDLVEPEAEPVFEGSGEPGEPEPEGAGAVTGFVAGAWGPAETIPPEEAGAPAEGAPAGVEEDVGAGERARGSLEAWVESLDVLGPEPELPELPVVAAGAPESAEGSERWRPAADAGEAGWEVQLGTESPGPDLLGPEPVAEEPIGAVEAEAAAGAGIEAETPLSGGEGAEARAKWEEDAPPAAEVRPLETAGGGTVEAELASAWWGDPEIHGTVPDPVEWVSQEDWERIAAYGAWSAAAGVEEPVAAVPELESGSGAAGRDEDADEVATETLAEVYAAQGFRTEAAEIYRRLLRRRPADPRLLSRLNALEGELAPAPEGAGFEGVGAEDAAAGIAWLEHVEASWPGGEDLVVAGPTPYAWMETGASVEAEAGETIGQRLRGLLAWQPESAPEPEPTLLLDEVAAEPPVPGFPGFHLPRPGPAGPAAAAAAETEDDLEMFRSWLKSLRK